MSESLQELRETEGSVANSAMDDDQPVASRFVGRPLLMMPKYPAALEWQLERPKSAARMKAGKKAEQEPSGNFQEGRDRSGEAAGLVSDAIGISGRACETERTGSPPSYLPTPEEIAAACERIQSEWSETERYVRWLIAHSEGGIAEFGRPYGDKPGLDISVVAVRELSVA